MATETGTSTAALPLARLHRRLGATLGPLDEGGPAVPLRYGEVAREVPALREGSGLLDLSPADRLEVLGADRQRFVNAYASCEVKALAPGETAYGFFTSPQGKILADVTVLAHEDRMWLELPPGRGEAVAEHLRRYVLADRVELLPLNDMLPLALVGPRAPELLAKAAGGALPEGIRQAGRHAPELLAKAAGAVPEGSGRSGRHARVSVLGTEVTVERRQVPGGDAWLLWVSASIAGSLWEGLLAAGAEGGLVPVGYEALEIVRVEEGVLRFGRDFGPESFPQETGLEERAVSYTKGCYLGQEVVARIHYRGGVQKAPRGLLFEEGGTPRPGAKLALDGREVGTVTTVVDSPALGRPAGLAILHRRGAEPGQKLDVEGGGTAEVRELPLVPAG